MVYIKDRLNVSISRLSSKKKDLISISDLRSLNELLRSGLSIRNCLVLLRTKANEKVFAQLLDKLQSGRLLEEIVNEYLPAKIAVYLRPLLRSMTFSSALELSLSFYDKSNENNRTIEKTILYPFVLLFVSLSGLYLFDAYGLDAILNMLKSFNTDLGGFTIIRMVFRILVYALYFTMTVALVLLLYFTRERNISLFYVLCCRYFPNSLIQVYFCEEFVSLFLICLELGYKTKDALEILKALHSKPLTSFLAFHLDEKLLEGNSLKEAAGQSYYDETLSKFINVAVYTNDFVRILSDYVRLSQNKISSSMKKTATIIQTSSYVVIGAIIIFIYQVLFLPMQAISSF